MSRIAKAPIELPSGVDVNIAGQDVTVKGKNGTLSISLNDAVAVNQADNVLTFEPREGAADGWANSPKLTLEPRSARPRFRPFCILRNFIRFGCSIVFFP